MNYKNQENIPWRTPDDFCGLHYPSADPLANYSLLPNKTKRASI
jgi:hypothetical protein